MIMKQSQIMIDTKLDIKVFGTGTAGHQMVVKSLKNFLSKAKIEFDLEMVTDVTTFMKFNVQAVPSIMVDGELLPPLSDNGAFNQSLRKSIESVLSKRDFGTLPRILIPIDFSEVSINAFYYGQRLATDLDHIVNVLHSYMPSSIDINDGMITEQRIIEIEKQKLDQFVSAADRDWGSDMLKIALLDQKFSIGFAADEILEESKHPYTDMVVMGNTGNTGMLKSIFGSVSTKVMHNSTVPVLLIPKGARYSGVDHILYASEDIGIDDFCLNELGAIATLLKAKIHIIHIIKESDMTAGYDMVDLVQMNYPDIGVDYTTIINNNITKTINDYAHTHHIDVIAMGTKHRNFIKSLMPY